MASPYKTPDQVVTAAAATPAFGSVYRHAAPTVSYRGKRYQRDKARNVREQLWYLAAQSMSNPGSVAALVSKSLDAGYGIDEAAVEAAREDVRTARADLAAAKVSLSAARSKLEAKKRRRDAVQRNIKRLEKEIGDLAGFSSVGDFAATLITAGINKGAAYINLETQLSGQRGELSNLNLEIPPLEAEVNQARSAVTSAQSELRAAQSRYDDALKAKRQAEERATIEQAREDARDAAAAAAAAREERAETYVSEAAYNPYTDPYGDSYFGEEDYSDWGEDEWLDAEAAADVFGDPELAEDLTEAAGEPIAGVTTVTSPWEFDRYYACDEGVCPGCPGCAEAAYGLEPMTIIITGIIAAVLSIAPMILNALSPPPSVDDSAADPNAGAKSIAEELAERTGVDKLLEKHGKATGEGAKPDLLTPALILGAVYLMSK